MEISVSWKEIWRRKHRNGNVDYWNEIADEYAECIRMSCFDHGIKIRNILEREGIISAETEVLDIGAGPGSITIPLAESVKRVVAVEPAREMVKHLLRNAAKRNLANIDVVRKKWEDIDIAGIEGKFDLAVCSNVLQVFQDVDNQLLRIALAAKHYCCAVINLGYDFGDIYKKLGFGNCRYSDFTCLLNIIHLLGWSPEVKVIETTMRRSITSGIRTWELFLNKYRKVTEGERKIIRQHVLENSKNGVYAVRGKMAVMWWEV